MQQKVLVGVALLLILVAGIFAVPAINGPVSGMFWFLFKVSTIIYTLIWFRGTFPRFRYDQLMNIGWKIAIPGRDGGGGNQRSSGDDRSGERRLVRLSRVHQRDPTRAGIGIETGADYLARAANPHRVFGAVGDGRDGNANSRCQRAFQIACNHVGQLAHYIAHIVGHRVRGRHSQKMAGKGAGLFRFYVNTRRADPFAAEVNGCRERPVRTWT
jgi:hypothetical protein